ncbi:HIRAN domain-containing protein [Cryobacterium sp. TMT4-10]|uniref:HIRAN domain-containing protein n=1 Tax=Cryobacterium sp. TMT4-10 TaxID=1259256 RepID=UPI00141B8FBF|nr:HIRAN domain-containing protein [Cryobacterium sp. TMT4-10]
MALAIFVLKWATNLLSPPPPNEKTHSPSAPNAGTRSGTSYVKKNLEHLPPQMAVSRSQADASIYLPSERWDELLVTTDQGLPTLFLQMHDGRLWLTEPSTGLLVSVGNRRLRRMGIWTASVRGVGYHKAAVRNGAFQPGAPVRLLREPDNAYDKNAVAVCSADDAHPAGYINKGMAAGLSKLIESGAPLRAISLAGQSPGEYGSNIDVLAATPAIVEHLLRRRPISTAPA